MSRPADPSPRDREGIEPDDLTPLVRQWPDEAPPAWLDENIRAAAHAAAGVDRQKAKPPRADSRAGRPAPARWWPAGATLAAAVLAVLVVIGRPGEDPGAVSDAPDRVAPAAAPTVESTPGAAGRQTEPLVPREPTRSREPRRAADPAPVPVPAQPESRGEPPPPARAAQAPTAPPAASVQAPSAAQSPAPTGGSWPAQAERGRATEADERRAQAARSTPAAPLSGEECIRQLQSLSRERRSEDGRRLFSRCRERFPDTVMPPALEREFGYP